MAGANNKSAKRHGYSNRQIETARASGAVLSLATLQKSAGDPAKPTKHHKALVADMAARKQGLTRKAEPPAGWKAAARGEGAEGRAAAKSARDAFVAKRDAAAKSKPSAKPSAASPARPKVAVSKDQKAALKTIEAAGPGGMQTPAGGWKAAQSLVRKGLVKMEVVQRNVPATKFYPGGSRAETHTLRGKLRMLTIVRWTPIAAGN